MGYVAPMLARLFTVQPGHVSSGYLGLAIETRCIPIEERQKISITEKEIEKIKDKKCIKKSNASSWIKRLRLPNQKTLDIISQHHIIEMITVEEKQYHLDVPDIGSVEEIQVIAWNCKEGEPFVEGEELCELVTQKSTFPLEAPFSGVVAKILCAAGSAVRVGETLAMVHRDSSNRDSNNSDADSSEGK